VSFTQPVQLDGGYRLNRGATVLSLDYGSSPAEVLLETSQLAVDGLYEITISNVHGLEPPAVVLAPNPSVWVVGCADKLTAVSSANQTVTLNWGAADAVLQTSADLVAWTDVAYAVSPFVVQPPLLPNRFYRLRLATTTNAAGPPVIISQPVSVIAGTGDAVQFSGVATGAGPLSYQWLLNGTPSQGQGQQTITFTAVGEAQVGEYRLAVTNAFGAAMSQPAYLLITNASPGLPFNTAYAQPLVGLLLLNSQVPPDYPFNTTTAPQQIGALLLNSQLPPDFPANTTLAEPPVSALILSSQLPPDYPFNTSIAPQQIGALLLNSQLPPDFPANTTLAEPPVSAVLSSSPNPSDFPVNTEHVPTSGRLILDH